jgi:hypothetical protein
MDCRLLFGWHTEKLESEAPFMLIAHHRRCPHRQVHVRNKKLDADGLAD